MPIQNTEDWKKYEESNTDPYGKCCVDVARRVMELLDEKQTPITHEDTFKFICKADEDINAGGITGFMAGCVAQMVARCHSRGEEWRIAYNAKHGVSEEQAKGGIVNPAIMTFNLTS